MKKCSDCNMEMIDASLYGKPRFIDREHDINKFYVDVKTGNTVTFLGLTTDETKRTSLRARVCPNCGKVELYINPDELKK